MTSGAGLSIVVPVYNGERALEELVAECERALAPLGRPFEIVLVNDGSRDSSWETICRLASASPRVRGLDLSRNYGQHNALLCGIRAARHPIVVTTDDDLQHPPASVPHLLQLLERERLDVVYGPPLQEQHGLLRDLASVVTKKVLQAALGAETARMVSPFRVFRTRLREGFERFDGPFVNIDVLLTWTTTRFGYVRVPHQPRKHGTSNYGLGRLLGHAMNMLTGFSTIPLQLASWIGLIASLFGVLAFGWVVGRYLWLGFSVPGFPFLAASLAVFSGAQLLALGVIGEYLARIHFRIMRKPAFVIREEATPSRETSSV